MSAFKQLNRQDVYVSDYQAQKSWRASGSLLDTYGIETLRGFSGSTPGYPYPQDYRNNRYEKLVYNSVRQNYLALSNRDLYPGSSSHANGDIYYTGSHDVSFQTTLTLSQSRKDTTEVGIISIPKDVYGTKIVPGTFVAEPIFENNDRFMSNSYAIDPDSGQNQYVEDIEYWYNSSPIDTGSYLVDESDYVIETGSAGEYMTASFDFQRPEVVDDGQGRLILSGAGTAFSLPERFVGDIIYNQGNAIITDPVVARYYSTYGRLNCQWKSNLPIYTYNVHCTVKESELNHTFNPSALTGSDNMVRSNITASNFRPYITSIGLYNEANELLAVAKTNKPIPKSENVDMTFVVKIDV